MNETKTVETHQSPTFTCCIHCTLNGAKNQTATKALHSHITYKHCAPTHKAGTKCHYEWNKNTRHPSRPSTHMSRTNTVPPPTKLGQSVITNGTKTPDSHQGPALARLIHTLRHLQESWDKVYTFAGTGLGVSGVTCPCGTQPSGAAISSKPWAYFHLPPCM